MSYTILMLNNLSPNRIWSMSQKVERCSSKSSLCIIPNIFIFFSLSDFQLPSCLISQSACQENRRRFVAGGVQAPSTTCRLLELSDFFTWRKSEHKPSTALCVHILSVPFTITLFFPLLQFFSSPSSEWKECPEYKHPNRECYFDANHTAVWTPYCVQLHTQNNVTYFNEDDCFRLENIG